jgi:hypothetical protein
MNNMHLMKFRIRQMENETKSTKKKKNILKNIMGSFLKILVDKS